jgi:hypothetical protein
VRFCQESRYGLPFFSVQRQSRLPTATVPDYLGQQFDHQLRGPSGFVY